MKFEQLAEPGTMVVGFGPRVLARGIFFPRFFVFLAFVTRERKTASRCRSGPAERAK